MSVLLSAKGNKIQQALHYILDTFSTDIDYSRGIFLKPNIVFAVKSASGEITSPKFVKNLILVLRERFGDIEITIGDGVAAGCDPKKNFLVSGYTKLAKELNVKLLDLHSVKRKSVEWKFGKLKLPIVALESTYINLPILKPSSACIISGALKNQKGLLLPEVKKHFHRLGLHEQIAELNKVIQPALSIMDCSRFFGRNVLISGNNCGEIDAKVCELLRIDEPVHVKLARDIKVFSSGFAVKGDEIKTDHILTRIKVKDFKNIGRLRLWSNPQTCTMCRYLFSDIKKNFYKRQNFLAGTSLFPYIIKGAEIVMGLNPKWRKEYKTVICLGICTRELAKENGFIYIPGCPPKPEDLNHYLPKSFKSNKEKH